MRRYGVARYLTPGQRMNAAGAEYERVLITNGCTRGCCMGEYLRATRSGDTCPLGVALGLGDSPDAFEIEDRLSSGVSPRVNMRRLAAIQRFVHDVDCGKIGPDDVAAALGVAEVPE